LLAISQSEGMLYSRRSPIPVQPEQGSISTKRKTTAGMSEEDKAQNGNMMPIVPNLI